ncbi:uncharacterized protein [Montipora capricornis]|uniref:uncharacterized protein n=1 Tax=Montipora capricornis TaxID=246305 RepID=UPI0035F17D8B
MNATSAETSRDQSRKKRQVLRKASSLYKLDPFLDQDGLIRVGGRIRRANVSVDTKHPVIIPGTGHLTELLIRHHHLKVNHMGQGMTHNELRQNGYWILKSSSRVARSIFNCVTCSRLRKSAEEQKMACLPKDRLTFSYSAVDCVGPFIVRERRSNIKCYGVLFRCMGSRIVHLETANSLDKSFYESQRLRQLRSDQGANFIGARNELKTTLSEMNQDQFQENVLRNKCEWIPFKFNAPHCGHTGGP